jgi:hypothetical protein
MASAVIGLKSPIAYVNAYGNQGKVQQLINMITIEEASPEYAKRFFLDQMAPACRDFLYKALLDLRDSVVQTVYFANGGNPFVATTGWADGGAEAATNALSAAGGKLISTLTAGGGGALYVSASMTTVIGIEYEIDFRTFEINDALLLAVSNSAALTAPLASQAVDEVSGPTSNGLYDSVKLRFVATATTTYFGFIATTTPAAGVLFNVSGVVPAPVIP